MSRMTRWSGLAAAAIVAATVVPITSASAAGSATTDPQRYVVVYADGASTAAGRAAVAATGARIVKENAEVGVATVETSAANFTTRVRGQGALLGVAKDRKVGVA